MNDGGWLWAGLVLAVIGALFGLDWLVRPTRPNRPAVPTTRASTYAGGHGRAGAVDGGATYISMGGGAAGGHCGAGDAGGACGGGDGGGGGN